MTGKPPGRRVDDSGFLMRVFVTGGTGYIGRRFIADLLRRGHEVHALVRPGSEGKLSVGCIKVVGNALNHASYSERIPAGSAFVQLIGVAHPSPAKTSQFDSVDFVSGREAVRAAERARTDHFVYLSVAQPAPVMRAYVSARARVEALIRAAGLNATILRPWYVLGPGHRWPMLLLPAYWILGCFPAARAGVRRLGFVTLAQMSAALVRAVENPCRGVRVWEVPDMRG